MIQPLVSEADWLVILQQAEEWSPPPKPTLVIAPHPDDETLGAGGLIAAQAAIGVPVSIAAVTDGEAAYPNANGLATVRQREQEQAVNTLGLPGCLIRFRLPDSAVSAHEAELHTRLQPLITNETLVIAPWINDWHPDHEACARVARKLCHDSGAELVSYLFWTWHARTPEIFSCVDLCRLELTPAQQSAKQSALACHRSQLQHQPEPPVLPGLLLAPAFRSFETFIRHV